VAIYAEIKKQFFLFFLLYGGGEWEVFFYPRTRWWANVCLDERLARLILLPPPPPPHVRRDRRCGQFPSRVGIGGGREGGTCHHAHPTFDQRPQSVSTTSSMVGVAKQALPFLDLNLIARSRQTHYVALGTTKTAVALDASTEHARRDFSVVRDSKKRSPGASKAREHCWNDVSG
jgi:hypothetical protein